MSDTSSGASGFKPYISADQVIPEFTVKAVVIGALFGILFGASTVYLALKAGLTVSASIPIAVLPISLGRKLLKTTILENNIVQTDRLGRRVDRRRRGRSPCPASCSWRSTPTRLGRRAYFTTDHLTLALVGGILGVLMMIPLRRSLIVKEHGELAVPRGHRLRRRCSSPARRAATSPRPPSRAWASRWRYAILQKVFHVIAETPAWVIDRRPTSDFPTPP